MNQAVPRARRPETCRMFENDVLERFSRIHPATPFVAYLPLLAWLTGRSFLRGDVGALGFAGLVLAGLLAWTLAEYTLHRYVFHWTNETAFGKRVHFILHGVHHDFPSDADRLVMPLGASLPVAVVAYFGFRALFGGVAHAEPFFVGFALGYLIYDGTHFAIHHFAMKNPVAKFVKRHHMLHHHADHDGGFGVSSPLWDVIFRSMPQVKRLGRTRSNDAANAA